LCPKSEEIREVIHPPRNESLNVVSDNISLKNKFNDEIEVKYYLNAQ